MPSLVLILAGIGTALAAMAHVGCIVGGPSWYRTMGAGPRMVRAAELGQWHATAITLGITVVLAAWAAYAWSAAGLLPALPLLRFVLPVISAVFLARGLLFSLLKPYFPGNSTAFWYWSSGLCLMLGLLYLVGTWLARPRISVA